MTSESFSRPGAVDLSGMAGQAQPPGTGAGGASTVAGQAAAGAGGSYVLDVTDETFQQEVVQRSLSVPVVIDLWADWCQPCKQLSPILEKLAAEYEGRFLLVKVDVDANPQISAAFQVQSIPSVFAVLRGQPVPLFQGAIPEPQVRQVLDQLMQVAVANGVSGRAEPVAAAAPAGPAGEPAPEPPHDPRFDDAYDAIEKGDFEAAAAAYKSVLNDAPGDAEAKAGLAQVDLLQRTHNLDPQTVRSTATDKPDDVEAQITAADLDIVEGRVDDALSRLVDTVGRTSGDDRDRARTHLLELFEVVGAQDPRVTKARAALARVLF
jgi:putative thioredoxin